MIKIKPTSFQFTPELLERFKKNCKDSGLSMKWVLEKLIMDYLANRK